MKILSSKFSKLSIFYYVIWSTLIIVLLVPKITKIDPRIVLMNSEHVTDKTYPLFKKYNAEYENNIFMLPGGHKYIDILKREIPKGSVFLSDALTAGSVSSILEMNPVYAMPGYPDLSRFCRSLLVNKLVTHETIIVRPSEFKEHVYLSGVEFVLLNSYHLDSIKESYPNVLKGYMESTDILDILFQDENVYLFRVLRQNIAESLEDKYRDQLWRLQTTIRWNFNIHSGYAHNILDLDKRSAVSFEPYSNGLSSFEIFSKSKAKISKLSMLIDKAFAEDIVTIRGMDRESSKFQIQHEIIDTSEKDQYLVICKWERRSIVDGLTIDLEFSNRKRIYKIYDLSLEL